MAQHLSLPCAHSLVCITGASREEVAGAVTVEVPGRGRGVSEHDFAYQVPGCPVPTPSCGSFQLPGLPLGLPPQGLCATSWSLCLPVSGLRPDCFSLSPSYRIPGCSLSSQPGAPELGVPASPCTAPSF